MNELIKATLETIYMSFHSAIISFLVAIPLSSIMLETRPTGLFPNKIINSIINRVVDLFRSIPFILLVVFLFPFTRVLIGTAIGTKAMIIPLIICAVPFEMRLVEEILSQVSKEIVEASQIDGATTLQIIVSIKLKSKTSLLINAFSVSLINIIGQSAMAGIVGGGGLGNYAIVYGFQRFNWVLIAETIVIIVMLVVSIQIATNVIIRKLERNSL